LGSRRRQGEAPASERQRRAQGAARQYPMSAQRRAQGAGDRGRSPAGTAAGSGRNQARRERPRTMANTAEAWQAGAIDGHDDEPRTAVAAAELLLDARKTQCRILSKILRASRSRSIRSSPRVWARSNVSLTRKQQSPAVALALVCLLTRLNRQIFIKNLHVVSSRTSSST